mmetsp:Transcript_15194/g.30791  ORF Transcript_15194/g.30791 Transcript_15194/m.30791 type:complete len:283 (-) Transcript_15194:386-1234(-)
MQFINQTFSSSIRPFPLVQVAGRTRYSFLSLDLRYLLPLLTRGGVSSLPLLFFGSFSGQHIFLSCFEGGPFLDCIRQHIRCSCTNERKEVSGPPLFVNQHSHAQPDHRKKPPSQFPPSTPSCRNRSLPFHILCLVLPCLFCLFKVVAFWHFPPKENSLSSSTALYNMSVSWVQRKRDRERERDGFGVTKLCVDTFFSFRFPSSLLSPTARISWHYPFLLSFVKEGNTTVSLQTQSQSTNTKLDIRLLSVNPQLKHGKRCVNAWMQSCFLKMPQRREERKRFF